MTLFHVVAVASTLCLALLAPVAARADGDVTCNGGPRDAWKPLPDVHKRAWTEGWTVLKAQVEGDCYEVYARTESGQVVEAFFHPASLQKLLVLRRGREIYRAPGFGASHAPDSTAGKP